MKRLITLVSVVLLSTTLVCSTGQSRGRNNSNTRPPTTSAPQNRPGNMGGSSTGSRTGNSSRSNDSYRPGGGNSNRPDKGYRPGGGNSNRPDKGYRPGGGNSNRPDKGYRPGGNTPPPQSHRPGGHHHSGHRPGGYRPGGNYTRPTPPPPPPPRHDRYCYHNTPPYRPYMPYNRPWRRPTPPPSWRPYYGCPTFSSILGVTLGTALNLSLDYLFNSGYSIMGYGNNQVYLSNVPVYNYTWPSATLYYGTGGGLQGSEFVYSSPGYDISRYNALYSQLVRQYGYPVSVQDTYGGVTATWWGYNNGYITLSFFNDMAFNGTSRYYTTLSIGN
ncbi:MAG: hypothetical protein MR822_07590 [Bacteroidales bacterium]|jgi:hypothetical protein|nr:hypothetical protein [Bacteroidales bacterium]MDD6960862.1 hypothetical protein [Bacteroidales bacterium]MDY6187056.1 hypothetical protein [Muribaculaceae bacterium]